MNCLCGGYAEYRKDLKFDGYILDGWACKSCGEEYTNPEKTEYILRMNQIKKFGKVLTLDEREEIESKKEQKKVVNPTI